MTRKNNKNFNQKKIEFYFASSSGGRMKLSLGAAISGAFQLFLI
jgi:hypothetical protein